MVHLSVIEARLSKLGIKLSSWLRPELRELQHILLDNEQIVTAAGGRYSGGTALLVATDMRLLLVDKKAMYLTVEDIRYDMISEIDFSMQLLDFSVTIFTVNKQHRFTSMRYKQHLRSLISYAQQRVMEIRQYMQQHSFPSNVTGQVPQAPQVQHFIPQPQHQPSPQVIYANTQPELMAHMAASEHMAFTPQLVGAAAVQGVQGSHWLGPNPYTKSPLVIRKQFSRFHRQR